MIEDRYKLHKKLELFGKKSSNRGIYIDKRNNRLVFVKLDSYKKIFTEKQFQDFFYEEVKRLKIKDIIIPRIIEVVKDNSASNYFVLVMEYLSGQSILKANIKTRLHVYMKVLNFLEKINSSSDLVKKYSLRRKSAIRQVIALPYFLSKNLILYPSYTILFIRCVGLIFATFSEWIRLKSNWICHGDINVKNILLCGEKVAIIDLANSYLSHRYFDISIVLNSTWYQPHFHEQFWSQIMKKFNFDAKSQILLKSFVVFNLLERLSQRYSNQDQERFYLNRIKMIVDSL